MKRLQALTTRLSSIWVTANRSPGLIPARWPASGAPEKARLARLEEPNMRSVHRAFVAAQRPESGRRRISRARSRSLATRRMLSVAALFAAAALAACGSHASPSGSNAADQPIPECEAFLSAYEHCLDSLGPTWIAQARVEQTRAAFATQAAQGPAAGQALRKQCVDRLSQIKTTCR
jgi:hypothetical protein